MRLARLSAGFLNFSRRFSPQNRNLKIGPSRDSVLGWPSAKASSCSLLRFNTFATGLVTSSMRSSGSGTTPERSGTRSVHGRTRREIMFPKNGRNSRVGAELEMHPLERRTMENGRLLETSGCSVLPFLPRQAKTCLRSSVSGGAARQQGLPRLLHNPLRAQEM